MSKARSPCTVCSTTIGINGLIAAPGFCAFRRSRALGNRAGDLEGGRSPLVGARQPDNATNAVPVHLQTSRIGPKTHLPKGPPTSAQDSTRTVRSDGGRLPPSRKGRVPKAGY